MESFKKTECLEQNKEYLDKISSSSNVLSNKQVETPEYKEKHLILFLRTLADSIETNTLQSEQLQKVGEFFMSYKMSQNENQNTYEEFDTMDVIKFITMGWYIYSMLLDKDKKHIEHS